MATLLKANSLMISGTVSSSTVSSIVLDHSQTSLVSMQVMQLAGNLVGTVHLQGSHDGQNFNDIGTVGLSGTTSQLYIPTYAIACPFISVSVVVTSGSGTLEVFVGLK